MKNTEISKIYQDIADLLEIKGDNPFKIRVYQRAARTIDHLPKEIKIMLEEGESLQDIPGIGEAIARKTTELVQDGKLTYYEDLKAELPEGITSLLEVPGIGHQHLRQANTGTGDASFI